MYLATPAMPALSVRTGPVPVPLSLARIERHLPGCGKPYDPKLRIFFADLLEVFGITLSDETFANARSNSFRHMAAEFAPKLTPDGAEFDLVVLAHATPDAEPGWPACTLSETLPGAPLAFAISEQDCATGYTALRLAADLAAASAFRRVLVLFLDQRTLLYGDQDSLHDCGVAMVLAEDGGLGTMSVRQWTGVQPHEVGPLLGSELGETGPDLAVVAGAGAVTAGALRCLLPGTEVRSASAGFPGTGVWLAMAEGLPAWAATRRRAALLDYDETAGCLCLCTIDITSPAAGRTC